ncbi:MAG: diacylglycerol kinase, partial [Planctomycetes bacterium]|nr:diacylglycerol kinase [Planctomycetota bacterium]
RYVNEMKSPLRGTAAYVYGALRVLARYNSCRVRVTADFGTVEKSVFLASTANTASYGGAIEIVPGATPTDGLLDLCVIDGVSRLRSFFILAAVLAGRHQAHPNVHFFQTARLEIDADDPLEIWADGELMGRTPVTIEAAPAAVRVLLPP